MTNSKILPLEETQAIKAKVKKDFCIIATGYPGYDKWIESCLTSYKKLGFFLILSYDQGVPPRSSVTKLADITLVKYRTVATLNYSSLWLWKLALPIVEEFGFKNVFVICGDNYIEKPEGFSNLISHLEGYDILTYWYDGNINKGAGRVGTMAWICSTKTFRMVLDEMSRIWYERPSGGKVEEKLSRAAFALRLKVAPTVKTKYDFRLAPDGYNGVAKVDRGLFGDIIGLRHIHREAELRAHQGLPPIEDHFLKR